MFNRWWSGNRNATGETKATPITITNYQPILIPCFTKTGDIRLAIRSYDCLSEPYFVSVDPYTFATECAPVSSFDHRRVVEGKPGYYTMAEIAATPYRTALSQFTAPPYQLQNQGLTHATQIINGAFLTVDMCPSIKPFEAEFYQKLTTYSDAATPVAICMTGLWMLNHADEFDWLTQQEKNGKLKITWVNHSYSHVYYADLTSDSDLAKNFLLSDSVNQTHELLATEQLLIKKGQSPSVFFRAPGLVTDENLCKKLYNYGLIPVGSDAWLAKDETPTEGSVILVHGNSNEHAGIEKAMQLLAQKRFTFFPLAKALDHTPTYAKDLPETSTLSSSSASARPS